MSSNPSTAKKKEKRRGNDEKRVIEGVNLIKVQYMHV
jgi:hypothetical protein